MNENVMQKFKQITGVYRHKLVQRIYKDRMRLVKSFLVCFAYWYSRIVHAQGIYKIVMTKIFNSQPYQFYKITRSRILVIKKNVLGHLKKHINCGHKYKNSDLKYVQISITNNNNFLGVFFCNVSENYIFCDGILCYSFIVARIQVLNGQRHSLSVNIFVYCENEGSARCDLCELHFWAICYINIKRTFSACLYLLLGLIKFQSVIFLPTKISHGK